MTLTIIAEEKLIDILISLFLGQEDLLHRNLSHQNFSKSYQILRWGVGGVGGGKW